MYPEEKDRNRESSVAEVKKRTKGVRIKGSGIGTKSNAYIYFWTRVKMGDFFSCT
jgi:hypothetical protein